MRNNIQKRNIRFKKINESWDNPIITDEQKYEIRLLALKNMLNEVEFNYKGKVLYGDELLKKYNLSISEILNLEPYGDLYDYNMGTFDLRNGDDEDYWSLLEDVYVEDAGCVIFDEYENEFETKLKQHGEKYYDVFEEFFDELLDWIGGGGVEFDEHEEKQITKDLLKIL